MKLLIDTNILLDVLQKRLPFYSYSSFIWKLCEAKKVTGYVSVLSFTNLIYIMRKELSEKTIEEVLKKLMLIFEFEDLKVDDVKNASLIKWKDFEDAIQTQVAKRLGADYIISRNEKDFIKSQIPVFSPEYFINNILTDNINL